MACLKAFDAVLLFMYCYLITSVVINWNAYQDCQEPIQLFLIGCFSLILLHHLFGLWRAATETIGCKRVLNFFIYFLLYPSFIALTILGIVWQERNQSYSPNCIPQSQAPWIIWFWIYFLGVMDLILVLLVVMKIIRWWKIRRFRQRLFLLVSEMSDQLDFNALMLAQEALNLEIGEQVGLSQEEIQTLPKRVYVEGIMNAFRMADSCPICCEDFVN